MKLFELEEEFIKNPTGENMAAFAGKMNEIIYGINPFKPQEAIDDHDCHLPDGCDCVKFNEKD